MNLTSENILLIGSILLLAAVLAGKASHRFGVPTLLLFLGVGMLAGSEGIGGIYFDDSKLSQFIGVVALNFILFSGGLATSWKDSRPILWQGVTLSTLGVLLTAVAVGLFTICITDFSIYEGLLLGAIVSSTDAAAVFSILGSKSIALKKPLKPSLELESGSNDPMAYFLTIAFLGLITTPGTSVWTIVPMFFQQIILGALLGLFFGKASKIIINRIKLHYDGLYPVLTVALLFLTFSFTDFIGGNGFLAVYLCGIFLGNVDFIHKKTMLRTFDGYAWLMQIVLFLTLGLLVFPSEILPFLAIGLSVSLFLILVARPLAVFICLSFFKVDIRQKLFISWVGLRGAVPIVFATYPLLAGIDKAGMIFNIVFFIALTSILIQGTTLPLVAGWLGVSELEKAALPEAEPLLSDSIKSVSEEMLVAGDSRVVGKMIVDIGLPDGILIAMILRKDRYITPNGSTTLQAQDKLVLLSESKDDLQSMRRVLE